jgi:hypothetical protein
VFSNVVDDDGSEADRAKVGLIRRRGGGEKNARREQPERRRTDPRVCERW